MEKLMGVQEISMLLGLSVSTLYKRTSAGTIPFYKIGKRVTFKPSEIEQWASNFKVTHRIKARELAEQNGVLSTDRVAAC